MTRTPHPIIPLILAFVLLGCSDDTTSGPSTTPVCAPNETVECTCVDGNSGFQLCNGDGSGYEAPCACPEDGGEGSTDPDGSSEEGGADTTADEGGESTEEDEEDSTGPEGGEG